LRRAVQTEYHGAEAKVNQIPAFCHVFAEKALKKAGFQMEKFVEKIFKKSVDFRLSVC